MNAKTHALARIRERVGDGGYLDRDEDMAAYLHDQRGYYVGRAAAVVRPATTAELAEVVAVCREAGVPVVPQGGNTGLCGGATPDGSGDAVVLSLARMNDIRDVDPINFTMTVEAGAILEHIHGAAAEHDLLFPLDLGAKGSCQIGGNLATNAGGINVVRYGNARDLVLGLEVVLADGRIWNGLSQLRKDNTGYDLKQLFLGSEGTLGIITAAVLKLFPMPRERQTALLAVRDPQAACELLAIARKLSGDALVSFEYMPRIAIDLVIAHSGVADPLDTRYEHHVLLELAGGISAEFLQSALEQIFEAGVERELVIDGVIAQSGQQRDQLWRMREDVSEAQRDSVKNDISVPIARIPELLEQAAELVQKVAPGARPCPFGHIGDGNIHYNILCPEGGDATAFRDAKGASLVDAVNELVMGMEGSFSAEHGVGQLRRGYLHQYKPPEAVDIMRRIKQALDPDALFNPGKVL
jgi:FAD/FMN-containing dehydrogenase